MEPSSVINVGPGFYNFRGVFYYQGIVNIGTQMSAIQLKSGKFLIIDCIELTTEVKEELFTITDNGALIEAVILTHPFHLVHLPAFHKLFPNVEYYGTPRHIRKFPNIQFAGDLTECKARSKWEPEVFIRIPEGMEFIRPLPEKTNHMCGAFVFHAASRTVHENDTIMLGHKPNIILKIGGFKHDKMKFHKSITGPGLIATPESPFLFRDWLLGIIKDWDFDNIAAGHMGVMIGGAKAEMQKLVLKSEKKLTDLQKKFEKKGKSDFVANGKYSLNLENDTPFNGDTTCECG